MRNLDAIMFRIMFVLIRVFRELDRYGLARVKINYAYILSVEWKFTQPSQSCKIAEAVRNRFRAWINEILRQRASANLDSDSQESVFFRVETLYNTIGQFRIVQ